MKNIEQIEEELGRVDGKSGYKQTLEVILSNYWSAEALDADAIKFVFCED